MSATEQRPESALDVIARAVAAPFGTELSPSKTPAGEVVAFRVQASLDVAGFEIVKREQPIRPHRWTLVQATTYKEFGPEASIRGSYFFSAAHCRIVAGELLAAARVLDEAVGR